LRKRLEKKDKSTRKKKEKMLNLETKIFKKSELPGKYMTKILFGY